MMDGWMDDWGGGGGGGKQGLFSLYTYAILTG